MTFQHADFDVANSHNNNSSNSNSNPTTTFYCAHCSGWFVFQQHATPPPSTTSSSSSLLLLASANTDLTSTTTTAGHRTVTIAVEGSRNHPPTTTTTTTTTSTTRAPPLASSSSALPLPPPAPQQQPKRIILRMNHNGGGGGSLPPPHDSNHSSANPPPPPIPEPNTIPTPYEIVQGLNEYVIGQRNVKIALSVGIYNHYKRLFINNHSMMNTNTTATTSHTLPEELLRSSPSQRPTSSFIIVRHPDRNSNMNDLNTDINDWIHPPGNQQPLYHQSSSSSSSTSNTNSNNESNFADYTNHLTQFGTQTTTTTTSTTTTKKSNPTRTAGRSNGTNSNTSMNDDDSGTNNIKYNGRDHSMDDTDENIEIDKSNILLLGPTGSGKTLLVRTLAKLIQVPLVITDATCLTQAGYVGEDVESILFKLYLESNHDIHKTQRGIIYIDEVDKIRKSGGPNISISRDVSGEGVQHALLKIVEGNVINVPKVNENESSKGFELSFLCFSF